MQRARKRTDLQVHIVEPHNDVVPPIHRAVASRILPFAGAAMVHLDSHPDLLLPVHMPADIVYKPSQLYDALSIENWLLPLVYAKHLDHIVWVKPPWANQIKVSQQSVIIGKCSKSGTIRLTSKENYFLTDGLFRKSDDLCDPSDLTLQVEEVKPSNWAELDESYKPSVATSDTNDSKQSNGTNGTRTWVERIQASVQDKPYILDIDLDFFSTANPFKDFLEAEAEQALRRLYHYTPPADNSDHAISTFTKQREKQLDFLERVFVDLEEKRVEMEEHVGDTEWDLQFDLPQPLVEVLQRAQEDGLDKDQLADCVLLCHTLRKHNSLLGQPQASANTTQGTATISPSVSLSSQQYCSPLSVHNGDQSLQKSSAETVSNQSEETDHSSNVTPSTCSDKDLHFNKISSLNSIDSTQCKPDINKTNTGLKSSSNLDKNNSAQPAVVVDSNPLRSNVEMPCVAVSQNSSSLTSNTEESMMSSRYETSATVKDITSTSPATQTYAQSQRTEPLTFHLLHDCGCTLDDTELPHHLSSPAQVATLMSEVKVMLESLPRPSLVTIARSSDDGYCPKTEVDKYERDILKMLEEVFGCLNITKHYED